MQNKLAKFATACSITLIIVSLAYLFAHVELIKVDAVIIEKYDDNPHAIGWHVTKYYFVLSNGETRQVTQADYSRHEVGDAYTYFIRIWK